MLELREIHAGYGLGEVLVGVNLVVPNGHTVALLGRNGAGKTTTLRVASGLLNPTHGQVFLDGELINGRSPEDIARRGVAHVPEGRGVLKHMSVLENLQMGGYASGSPLRRMAGRIEMACSRFPVLEARMSQDAGSLSGGEQQMLVIARALMSQPRVLLIDEPSLGLAPIIVAELYRLLRQLHDDGLTILLVEQYVSLALETATSGYVLGKGQVVMSGTSAELADGDRLSDAYLSL